MMKKRGLGKGLSALLKEETVTISNGVTKMLNIDEISASIYQPRKYFDQDKIEELANSIKHSGILQPITVILDQDNSYKIIAGERRWRASKIAGLREIPAIIREVGQAEALEIAMIENVQRDDLSSIEEAEGFERLMREHDYSQEELSQIVGKSRSHIANILRLNSLPENIKDLVNTSAISTGHARCLINNNQATQIAEQIISQQLNVRQTEELVKGKLSKVKQAQKPAKKTLSAKETELLDEDLKIIVESLENKFGVKIVIENDKNRGKIVLFYESPEELDKILKIVI